MKNGAYSLLCWKPDTLNGVRIFELKKIVYIRTELYEQKKKNTFRIKERNKFKNDFNEKTM